MQISLDTGSAHPDELTALIALCASLGGRLPVSPSTTISQINVSIPTTSTETIAAEISGEMAKRENTIVTDRNGDADMSAAGPNGQSEGAVDSKGTPWDARIHSESRATVADGSWRKRRGVGDDVFEQVMAELTEGNVNGPTATKAAGTVEATTAGIMTSPAPAENDEAPPPPPADEPEGNGEQVPPPPALTEPSVAASAPAAGDGQFGSFADFVAAVSKHGKTYAELNENAGVLGVPMFKDLKDHADKWDMFFAMI